MNTDLKNILTHLSPDIDPETLLLYLQNQLDDDKRHHVEKQLIDSPFDADAVEGLSQISSRKKLMALTEQLNRDLAKKLETKKKRRQKLQLQEQPWLFISVFILLLLIVLCYLIVRKLLLA